MNIPKFCVVAQFLLYLNVFKVNFVNSFEMDGDIPATEAAYLNPARDMMTINMHRVYDKYSKKHHHHHEKQDVNTIRSFRCVPGE